MAFVFKYSLALFSRFLHFLVIPRLAPHWSFEPYRSFGSQARRRNVCGAKKLEKCVQCTHFVLKSEFVLSSFWLRFGMPFFVFNNIVASYVSFYNIFQPAFPRRAGVFPFQGRCGPPPALAYDKMSTK